MSRFFAPARLTIVASVWLLLVGPLFGMTNGDRLDEKARCEPAELDATGTTLPSPYYLLDDVQYFPHGEEFRLAREQSLAREKVPWTTKAWQWGRSVWQRARLATGS
jgi:hypothetical protein